MEKQYLSYWSLWWDRSPDERGLTNLYWWQFCHHCCAALSKTALTNPSKSQEIENTLINKAAKPHIISIFTNLFWSSFQTSLHLIINQTIYRLVNPWWESRGVVVVFQKVIKVVWTGLIRLLQTVIWKYRRAAIYCEISLWLMKQTN